MDDLPSWGTGCAGDSCSRVGSGSALGAPVARGLPRPSRRRGCRWARRIGPPRARRAAGFGLVFVLVLLSVAMFASSWRQADVVNRAARAAEAASDYQEARQLATAEY